jgi:hypothetical protein
MRLSTFCGLHRDTEQYIVLAARWNFFAEKRTAKMLRLCGPAAEKPEVLKSWYFTSKKPCPCCVKCQKRRFSSSSRTRDIANWSRVLFGGDWIYSLRPLYNQYADNCTPWKTDSYLTITRMEYYCTCTTSSNSQFSVFFWLYLSSNNRLIQKYRLTPTRLTCK